MSFLSDLHQIGKMLDEYRTTSEQGRAPVIRQKPLAEIIQELKLNRLLQQGNLQGETLKEFLNSYLQNTTRLDHPGYMAHQVPPTHTSGALGALVDASTNNPMAIYEMGPAAASIEFFMINWMLAHVGFKPAPLDPAARPVTIR